MTADDAVREYRESPRWCSGSLVSGDKADAAIAELEAENERLTADGSELAATLAEMGTWLIRGDCPGELRLRVREALTRREKGGGS